MNRKISLSVGIMLIFTPDLASAATIADLQAQLTALMAQVAAP